MWVSNLLLGPWARPVALLAAFLAWTAYQRHDAAEGVRQAVEAQAAKDRLAAVQKAQQDAAAARAAADRAEAELEQLRGIRDDLVASGGQCRLSDDQLERLRAIR
jgi:hypothetical protein